MVASNSTGDSSQCGTAGIEAGKEALRMRFRSRLIKLFREKGGWFKSRDMSHGKNGPGWEERTNEVLSEKGKMKLPKTAPRLKSLGRVLDMTDL